MTHGPRYFPFTEPSVELEIFYNEDWMEVLGCGAPWVLQKVAKENSVVQFRWSFLPRQITVVIVERLTLEKTVGVVGRSGINGA